MFTGIVEEIGEVVAVKHAGDSAVLTLKAGVVADDIRHGASIAVNGVCLTVVGWAPVPDGLTIDFDVMAETLNRSVIGDLDPGDKVNLERAARVDSRLDGHVVQGHVDGTGVVLSRTPGDGWESVRFGLPADLARFVAEKGSIAVHGVSLTITAVGPAGSDGTGFAGDWFEVGLIPETLRATTLGLAQPGTKVNLETDVLAKYVARLLETQK
jgi:riboflavin synthase